MTDQKMQQAINEHQRYTSLELFEPKRLEIAKSISKGMRIPLSEFEAGNHETAFFHWLTTMLSVEDWLRETIFNSYDRDEFGEGWDVARDKLATGAVLRLFMHPFALSFDDQRIKFVNAFAHYTSANVKLLNALLNGWELMRELTGSLAEYWWDEGAIPPISDSYFEPLDDVIEDGGDDLEFLRNVYRDAAMQIATEFDLMLKIQAAESIGLTFPDEMPENADRNIIIDAVKQFISQAAMIRRPISVNMREVGESLSFAKAAKSLDTKSPVVLIESAYETGEAFLFNPLSPNGSGLSYLLRTLSDAGMKTTAVGFSMV